jgi:hypothetical protein
MAKKTQVQKFRETAKEAGTDDSEERFNATLKDMAKNVARKKCRHRRMLRKPVLPLIKSRNPVDPVASGSGNTHVPTCRNETDHTRAQKLAFDWCHLPWPTPSCCAGRTARRLTPSYSGAGYSNLQPRKAGSQEKCRWRHPQLSLRIAGEPKVIESGFFSKSW